MAILQENKQKVHPVIDYCELNKYVDVYIACTDILCTQIERVAAAGVRCHNVGPVPGLLTNTVKIKGTWYCLNWLGFGLNRAPNIMTTIMNAVGAQDKNIQKATSSYVDDVFVNESILSSQPVKKYFESFRLTCKEPDPLQDRVKVLGLHISGNGERLCWRRGGDIPKVLPVISHWSSFFIYGKLVGHFPIHGVSSEWLWWP